MNRRQEVRTLCSLAIALLALASCLMAADHSRDRRGITAVPTGRQVEMFAAMKSGDIEVKLIPRDDTQARVLIKNNTGKPLSVKLPEAFAGVPTLNQAAAAKGTAKTNNQAQNQGFGGGMGMGGMGMGGMGMGGMGGMGGGGFFNVAPDKVAQLRVETVCLEHGKQNPRPAVPYEIKPIESFTSNPELQEFVKLFGQGHFDHQAAQAAAWHLANGMSWQELADKRVEHLNGTGNPYFTPEQLMAAQQITQMATVQAQERAQRRASQTSSSSQRSQ